MPDRLLHEEVAWSDSLARCSEDADLAWSRFLLHPDDWGRFKVDPEEIRLKRFPKRRSITPDRILGFLREYEREGQIWVWREGEHVYGEANTAKWEKKRYRKATKIPAPPWGTIRPLRTDVLQSIVSGADLEAAVSGAGLLPRSSTAGQGPRASQPQDCGNPVVPRFTEEGEGMSRDGEGVGDAGRSSGDPPALRQPPSPSWVRTVPDGPPRGQDRVVQAFQDRFSSRMSASDWEELRRRRQDLGDDECLEALRIAIQRGSYSPGCALGEMRRLVATKNGSGAPTPRRGPACAAHRPYFPDEDEDRRQ